ncbi:hypothetical protein HMPREF7545_0099 [Selenomonas noxia ATCC 43541]|nr:hypothetical protein HMPREF7545_0099 [Selenomonas noxia ATCC 43541]
MKKYFCGANEIPLLFAAALVRKFFAVIAALSAAQILRAV